MVFPAPVTPKMSQCLTAAPHGRKIPPKKIVFSREKRFSNFDKKKTSRKDRYFRPRTNSSRGVRKIQEAKA